MTLLRTGRTDFAILGLRDLAIARAKGRDLVAVMAIVQDPLPARERGAPSHPGLVLAVTRETLQDSPDLVRATVHALQRGYRETLADPESAIAALATAAPGTDRVAAGKQLDAVATSFQGHDGTIGTFDIRALERWAAWAQRTGIVDERPAVKLMFEGSFARSGAGKAAEEDG